MVGNETTEAVTRAVAFGLELIRKEGKQGYFGE